MRTLLALLLLTTAAAAQTTVVETPGNLQATRALGCFAPAEMKPLYTPADITPATIDCIAKGRINDALFLFGTMLGYAAFDGQRVTDPTAGQARGALAMQIGQAALAGDPALFAKWQATLQAAQAGGSPLTAEQCALHRRLGPPDYRPDYMIAHGIRALTQPDAEPLKTDFDADATWKEVLTAFLKCEG